MNKKDKEAVGEITLFIVLFISGMLIGGFILWTFIIPEEHFPEEHYFIDTSLNLTVTSGKEVHNFCTSNDYEGGWIDTRGFGINCYNNYKKDGADITEHKLYNFKGCELK